MNRAELHSLPGFHPASIVAAAAFLRLTVPRVKNAGDATAIIKNEGYLNGFLDAVEALQAVAAPEPPKTPKKEYQPYGAPQTVQPENQNKP